MNRLRTVAGSLSAKKHHKQPPEHSDFRTGDRVVFLRHEGAHTVFAPEADPTDIYVVDDETFENSTKPVSTL